MSARGRKITATVFVAAGAAVALTGCANDPPAADFTLNPNPTAGQTVTFDGSASHGGRDEADQPIGVARWEWDLDGNGSFEKTTQSPSVTHTYEGTRTVQVGLRVVSVRNVASAPVSRTLVTNGDQTALAPAGDCDPGAADQFSCSGERVALPTGEDPEPVATEPSPNWDLMPSFTSFFGSFSPGYNDRVAVATGADRVFVLDSENRIQMFDASSLASQGSFGAIGAATDIAFYRNELYVLAADGDVAVYGPDGTSRRVLRMIHPAGATTAREETTAWTLAVAWGEVWTTLSLGEKTGQVLLVRDARTGALKSAGVHHARSWCTATFYDPNLRYERCQTTDPFDSAHAVWWPNWMPGISAIPEMSALVSQCRVYQRSNFEGLTYGQANGLPRELEGIPTCSDWGDDGVLEGTEAVPGRSHFLQMANHREEGLRVHEYSVHKDGEGKAYLVGRRDWAPRDDGGGVFNDIAYRTRDAKIDWSGQLTEDPTPWLHSAGSAEDKCLHYLVSDADIYVAGQRGERWYEPARGITSVELRIDDHPVKSSTAAEGDFCINTHGTYNGYQLSSGVHRVELRANLTNPTREIKAVNENLRTDDTAPGGYLVAPEDYVRGTVTFQGQVEDARSGAGEWRFEVLPPGGAWRHVCTGAPLSDVPGRFGCDWNSANGQFPDGTYQVRATMVDRASNGGNAATTATASVDVANAEPPDDGGTAQDSVDQAFDADWVETGPPETAFEDVGPDDLEFNDSQADTDHRGAYAVTCAANDEWGVALEPTYILPEPGAPPLNLGPEAAMVSFLGNAAAPVIPAAAFEQAERTSEYAIYVAREGSALRAFLIVENDPALGWITKYYEGCSAFPGEPLPEVGLP